MVILPNLYDHQMSQKDAAKTALRTHRAVIMAAPPGTGKTRMAKWILGSSLNRHPLDGESGHSLFCVHRRGLVENASDSFSEEPKLPHGVLMSGHEPETYRRVQVASIDTLLSWFVTEKRWTSTMTFDLVAFDECHSHFPKLKALLDVQDMRRQELGLKPTFVLGLSATPAAKGLADLFGAIVPGPKTQWLIDQGYLSPFRYFRATQGNLDALVKSSSADGYTKDSVCEAMKGLSGDLVRDWKQIAEGRATVGFFPRLDQARQAQQDLIDAGIDAEYVDGQTDDEERRRLFRALNNGVIQYLCNVGVIERGTDIPRVQCVQLCTAIGTRERYLQMIGRGSRVHPEKKDCLVLDHGGNVQRHGFFEDDIPWTLDMSRAKECPLNDRPTMECPRCHEIYRGGKCKECGYEPTRKEREAQGLEFDGSELKEIVRSTAPKTIKSAEQLMIIALYKAGNSELTYQQALGIAYGMARSQGTVFNVPKMVVVGGHAYRMVPWKSPDAPRKVKVLYPFTNGGGHGGPYIVKMPNRSYSAPY